jgi:hypothetical protein
VRSLKRLSSSDARSQTHESDIFSSTEQINSWAYHSEEVCDNFGPKTRGESIDPLRAFDSEYGVIRDVRYIRSRFIGLYVTEDNFDPLINSVVSLEASKKLGGTILTVLKGGWRVRRDALDSLESRWSKTDRDGYDMCSPDKSFLTVITVTAYLSQDWEQTRELSYVAVAETLIPRLLELAGLKSEGNSDLSDFPMVKSEDLVERFTELLESPAHDNLRACVSRACIYTGIGSAGSDMEAMGHEFWRFSSMDESDTRSGERPEGIALPGSYTKARELVYSLYERHKIGRNEPSSSLFRVSTNVIELELPREVPKDPDLQKESSWPNSLEFPDFRTREIIFATASDHTTTEDANLCIFVLDPSVFEGGLQSDKLSQSKSDWSLRVKRIDKKPGSARSWNNNKVINHAKDIVSKVEIFFDHLQNTEHLPDQCDNFSSSHGSEQVWGPKKINTQWSVLTKQKSRSKTRMANEDNTPSTPAAEHRIGGGEPVSYTEGKKRVKDEDAPQCSRLSDIPLEPDTNATMHIPPRTDHETATPSRKRGLKNEAGDGESGSPSTAEQKRRKNDPRQISVEDYLHEEEIEVLLKEGYFS